MTPEKQEVLDLINRLTNNTLNKGEIQLLEAQLDLFEAKIEHKFLTKKL